MRTLSATYRIVYGLLIAAFVLAGVSPACKFVSGKSFLMEICKADGSIETWLVSADTFPVQEGDTQQDHQSMQMDCAFCFSTGNLKFLVLEGLQIDPSRFEGQSGLLARSADIPRQSRRHLYAPREPPSFISKKISL